MKTLPAVVARVRARLHWNQDIADVALGLALTALVAGTVIAYKIHINAPAAVLLALQTLPIMVRRHSPILVLCATGFSIMIYSSLGYPDANGSFGVFTAFYTVAANEPRERATVAALITAIGITITFASYAVLRTLEAWTVGLTLNLGLFAFAWLLGDNLRVRRAYTRELEERAARLEREREDKAAAAVGEERARIARELHDVVAHYVSVAVVQAAGARRVLDRDPAAARDALAAVETAGRTALTEMRRMLEVLRTDDSGLGPQPGLGELDRLVQRVRDAGIPVGLRVQGNVADVSAGVDLAAYRIVQEALTNVVKHAGRANAVVRVARTADTLEIEVSDDGRGAAAPLIQQAEGGHGLIGMRERVALFGGSLNVGPAFPGGWRVSARLPLDTDDGIRDPRRDKATDAGVAAAHSYHEPSTALVAARVVPPLIGRVIPPRRTARSEPEPGRRERGGNP